MHTTATTYSSGQLWAITLLATKYTKDTYSLQQLRGFIFHTALNQVQQKRKNCTVYAGLRLNCQICISCAKLDHPFYQDKQKNSDLFPYFASVFKCCLVICTFQTTYSYTVQMVSNSYSMVARDLSLKTILRPRAQLEGERFFSMTNPMVLCYNYFYVLPDWSDTHQSHGAGWPNLAT